MKKQNVDRRDFIKGMATSAAMISALPTSTFAVNSGSMTYDAVQQTEEPRQGPARLKFAVIGTNHPHIYGMVAAALRGGGEMVSLYEAEPELVTAFKKQYPDVKMARSEAEILEDPSIKLVLSSIVPDQRAPLGIRVMKHGKDYMVDKPGITSLDQLAEVRKVQAETKRIYSIDYSERFENKATIKAAELARAGAIGKVVQTVGVGPHRMSLNARPPWFFDKKRYGGIICDIGSHQADQFLYFTNSDKAEVVASQIANVNHPQYPNFEDFGDLLLRGDGGAGYIRVDWFTPDGLSSWGDGRLTILGTDGFMEVRKNVDIAGKGNGSHLFLVDQKETRYIDTTHQPLYYGEKLIDDVLNRTETAMTQHHCFLATELVLKAQANAQRVSFKA